MNYNVTRLENEHLIVETIDFAAGVYQVYLKKDGVQIPILSTPKTYDLYIENTLSYGRTMGRTAGKLHKLERNLPFVDFNEDSFLMHGGPSKFSLKKFETKEVANDLVIYALEVKDREDRYQGHMKVMVTYQLIGNTLRVRHQARSDKDTLCNMTFHPYFNLNGDKDLSNHQLKIYSDTYLSQDASGIFKDRVHVENTKRDYRVLKTLNIQKDNELDDIFILKQKHALDLINGHLKLSVFTNYDALVVYTQNKPTTTDLNHAQKLSVYSGVAIECQKPQSDFVLLKANEPYDFYIDYQISTI
ncbi:Aldose 1-epimerase [Acholeplasma oculi]|uniref:Aldose 1-epimerase n=1 Tax=Acholeplasma oculi TaxID=35623 RepID=A0A061ABG5_9MOLU|nr:hypothetical protein [Acholeplasma oculi]CDR31195.1 Aldose 1-epimerase [Acholeplasma oculi]SKC37884.1 aldose 1-epimerase [Acholeplasma oculi]SUT91124.1 Aldose 1-epimerase [Acholeplasma oculi]